jgi:hypothetical protein
LLVWTQADNMTNVSVWATSFGATGPLKTPQILDNLTTANIYDPVVAMMGDGSKGIAVWDEPASGAGYDMMVSDFTASGGWGAPARVGSAYFSFPVAIMDQVGTVTVAYGHVINNGSVNVRAIRRVSGQGWGEATLLENTNWGDTHDFDTEPQPRLGVDANGTVHIAWARKVAMTDDDTYSIITRRWAAGGWQPEETLFMKNKRRVFNPDLAVGDDGHAAVGFFYIDPSGTTGDLGVYNAMVSLFR